MTGFDLFEIVEKMNKGNTVTIVRDCELIMSALRSKRIEFLHNVFSDKHGYEVANTMFDYITSITKRGSEGEFINQLEEAIEEYTFNRGCCPMCGHKLKATQEKRTIYVCPNCDFNVIFSI